MSDIWQNPLMWQNGSSKKTNADTDIDLDALDRLIEDAHIDNEFESIGLDIPIIDDDTIIPLHIPDIKTKNFQNILIGTPKTNGDDSKLRLDNVLRDLPSGHLPFGNGVFYTGAATSFDFYNAVGMVGETGGIAQRLGVSDGSAIESAIKMGLPIREAVDKRDMFKILLSLLSINNGKSFDKKNLDYLREYASTHNLDALRESASNMGLKIPENITTTDLYYLILSTKADQGNFDIALNNLNKLV